MTFNDSNDAERFYQIFRAMDLPMQFTKGKNEITLLPSKGQ